jgi:hypothetical protein
MADESVAYLFRGTTVGFSGTIFPRLGLTSTTSDPVVATLFAMTAARHGQPVVYVIPVARLTGPVQDRRGRSWLAALEAEFVVAMSPTEIASVARAVGVGAAKACLEGLGVVFPLNIFNLADLDTALRLTKRLRPDEIELFVHSVGSQP